MINDRQHVETQFKLQEFYDYIIEFMLTHHVPPSANQLRLHFEISHSTASAWIAELKGLGRIRYVYGLIVVDGIEYRDVRNVD